LLHDRTSTLAGLVGGRFLCKNSASEQHFMCDNWEPPSSLIQPMLRLDEDKKLLVSSAEHGISPSPPEAAATSALSSWAHFAVSLIGLLATDRLLQSFASHLAFPPPLIGMFGLLTCLLGLDATGHDAKARAITAAFAPALTWITRWLPLFYVPPLVVVPREHRRLEHARPVVPSLISNLPSALSVLTVAVAIRKMDASECARTIAIVVAGMPACLVIAASIVLSIRRLAGTKRPTSPGDGAISVLPPARSHLVGWAGVALVAGAGLLLSQHHVCLTALLLACTVCGFVAGTLMAARSSLMPHPVVWTIAGAHAGILAAGSLSTVPGGTLGYGAALAAYLHPDHGGWGAGDVLMGLLGSVVLSFAFHIWGQRGLLRRHAPEVLGCACLASLLSLVLTGASPPVSTRPLAVT
jgi:hypothetical protein